MSIYNNTLGGERVNVIGAILNSHMMVSLIFHPGWNHRNRILTPVAVAHIINIDDRLWASWSVYFWDRCNDGSLVGEIVIH